MGEFAEDAIDASLDEYFYAESEVDPDFTYEYFRDGGGLFSSGAYRSGPRYKKCRYCGAESLEWGLTEKGWRLLDKSNAVHQCKQYRKKA